MKKILSTALFLGLIQLTASAIAGAEVDTQVYVDTKWGIGNIRDAAAADTNTESIGCMIWHDELMGSPRTTVTCTAKNIAGDTIKCTDVYEDPGAEINRSKIEAVSSISSLSEIMFKRGVGGECEVLRIINASYY